MLMHNCSAIIFQLKFFTLDAVKTLENNMNHNTVGNIIHVPYRFHPCVSAGITVGAFEGGVILVMPLESKTAVSKGELLAMPLESEMALDGDVVDDVGIARRRGCWADGVVGLRLEVGGLIVQQTPFLRV